MQETQEMQVWFLGWEDPLEKEMATHSSILDWKIPWSEEPGRLQSMGSQKVRHDWATKQYSTLPESRNDITFSEHTASEEPNQNRILSLHILSPVLKDSKSTFIFLRAYLDLNLDISPSGHCVLNNLYGILGITLSVSFHFSINMFSSLRFTCS